MTIRGNTIKYCSIKKKVKLEDENKILQEIKELEDELNNDFSNAEENKILELSQKKQSLIDIRKEKIEGVMLRSRSRYQDLGEKPSKYFFNLENRNFINKTMTKLIENDGTEVTETKEVLKCQRKFYENLYNENLIDADDVPITEIIGENENKLTIEESEKLEGDIKIDELSNALKNMKNEKSPGLDGFTVEFYKFFWVDLKYFILRSLNYGYHTGTLSVTQKQGLITCLPKPNKSRHYLKNWRPISLLNVIYKLASSVIANRLKLTLDKLINGDQKGFISGRFIGENVRLMYDILFETKNQDIPGMILSIDFEKAFDTVSWKFIKRVLQYFNFGPSIISWINIFQKGSESCIIQNGFMSDFFNLKRGCRQGDPISPYVFILCAEILGKMIRDNKVLKGIRINGKEFRLSQYADDTQLFLDGTEQSLKETLKILNLYYSMSGLKINIEKTRAIWIGSLSHSNRQLCREYKLDWTQGEFKILGVTFSVEVFDIWDLNTGQIYSNIEALCKVWSKRKLTLFGRITIIKSLALAKFVHLFLALPNPPGELMKKLDKIFYKFLWNSGPDRIKRNIIIKDVTAGGLRMINTKTFIKALHISWLRRVVKQSENISWCSMANINFEKLFNFGPGYVRVVLSDIQNPFWRDILTDWGSFCDCINIEKVQDILNAPLWYNKKLINGHSFFINEWYKKGIRQVSDLLNEQGNMFDFEALKTRYGIRGTFLEYEALKNKIPNRWKNTLNDNTTTCITNRFNVTCNIYLQFVLKDKKGCRRFYDLMLQSKKIELNDKWMQEFGFIDTDEYKHYNKIIASVKEIKLKDFQFKVINKILVTKSFLYRINKTDNNICEYCNQQTETIYHLFVECEIVKQFWNELQLWLNTHSTLTLNLDGKQIIFSNQDRRNTIRNYLSIIAKHYIYTTKFTQKTLRIDNFINLLKKKFQSEKYIALMNNTMTKFFAKWAPLYNYFNTNARG